MTMLACALAVERNPHIARATASLERSTGKRPEGWRCRYGPSVNARRLVAEQGGYLYDSDHYGDELPFWVMTESQGHLIVPCSMTTNDGEYFGNFGNRRYRAALGGDASLSGAWDQRAGFAGSRDLSSRCSAFGMAFSSTASVRLRPLSG